jgi:hypothetical protein
MRIPFYIRKILDLVWGGGGSAEDYGCVKFGIHRSASQVWDCGLNCLRQFDDDLC